MLSSIRLQHFKCFEDLELPLLPLTLLSGTNAAGKSSILQSLALLHQTVEEHEWSRRLMLNGDVVRLGTVADVVDKVHGRRSLSIELQGDFPTIAWAFSGDREEMSMTVQRVSVDGTEHNSPARLQYLLPTDTDNASKDFAQNLRRLTYLTAERMGPREVYRLEDHQSAVVVGSRGENAVSVLFCGRDENVHEQLLLPEVSAKTRLRQAEARMAMFFPGCALTLQKVPSANAITLGLRTSNDTDFHRPVHAGFGLTQLFPVIVAGLSSQPGDLLLVENPEVHLHPAGQSQIGQFLAELASCGIQVLVETHSDHVFNGIRRAVKSSRLSAEDVAVHFFRPATGKAAQVVSTELDKNGSVKHWPEGFFDQFDRDANHFADWDE